MASLQDWHIPFYQDNLSLRMALTSVPPIVDSVQMPLMLRLQRDPNLSFLGQLIFRAGLDQHQHDCIHIMLGRGLLPMDQAFVMGFTLGSSKKNCMTEPRLHAEVGRHFYREVPLFDATESALFKEGVKLAYISFCAPMDTFDFLPWYDSTLGELREAIGLEQELITAYYAVEKHRYPHSRAAQRLLPNPAQASAI